MPADFGRPVKYELHHFCDASLSAYDSVSYLRAVNAEGKIHCTLLLGKSRLAPIRQMTIPRLELCAAVIAVRMDRMLSRELTLEIQDSVFWTDSMIVLQYIYTRSKRFQTFVANRLSVIPDGSVPNQWRKVGTKENPADDVSRGLRGVEMVSSDRWKRVLKECMMRRRLRGNPQVQRMADLSFDRVTPGKPPFSFVGVECFGPFVVKTGRTQFKRSRSARTGRSGVTRSKLKCGITI